MCPGFRTSPGIPDKNFEPVLAENFNVNCLVGNNFFSQPGNF